MPKRALSMDYEPRAKKKMRREENRHFDHARISVFPLTKYQILKTQPSREKRDYMHIYGLKTPSTSLRTKIQIYQLQYLIIPNIQHQVELKIKFTSII